MLKKTCRQCGKEFLKPLISCSQKTWKVRKYCSQKCYGEFVRTITGKNHHSWNGGKRIANCLICNKEFKVHSGNIGKFCSVKCYSKFKETLVGEKACHWIIGNIGISGVHKWLTRTFGKADRCEHPECKRLTEKFEWALLKGKEYKRKRGNFWKLCVYCHRKYDMTDKMRRRLREIRINYLANINLIKNNLI